MYGFLHTFSPSALAVSVGWLHIYWYSLFIVVAIFAGIFTAVRLAKPYGITADEIYDAAFSVTICAIIGARLYAVGLFPHYYFVEHPLEIFQVWKGGLAIHGALIGGALALAWHAKKKHKPFLLWGDIVVVSVALGQAIGRWGNYFNQELFGTPTSRPWGIPILPENRPPQYINSEYFHPVFLYESILNFLVFLLLVFLHRRRIKKLIPMADPKKYYGVIAMVYLACYAVIRLAMEQLRIDQTAMVAGIRLPVLVSLALLIGVSGFFILRYNKKSL